MRKPFRFFWKFAGFFVFVVSGSAAIGAAGPAELPAVKEFIGTGLGAQHAKAPKELEQFGRLVGVWTTEAEMRGRDGTWHTSAPGTWVWKYTIGGFAVSDMFLHTADKLPAYMAGLGRDYMLTANRIYDVANKKWQVAWMANGAGTAMGQDFGTFTANLEGDELIMTSPADSFGLQRVIFYEFKADSFRWKSDYSSDGGKTWNTVMRMLATRVTKP